MVRAARRAVPRLVMLFTVRPSASSGVGYMGCYVDKRNDRDLPNQQPRQQMPYSRDQCATACRSSKSKYYALQYKAECWCGDSYGKHGTATNCKCPANSPNMSWKSCVYILEPTVPPTAAPDTPQPTAVPTSSPTTASLAPSVYPTRIPSRRPTGAPTASPTWATNQPTTASPSGSPTTSPAEPTGSPSLPAPPPLGWHDPAVQLATRWRSAAPPVPSGARGSVGAPDSSPPRRRAQAPRLGAAASRSSGSFHL
eukprot:TRINITY_DN30258_c0_g1_i4.p1 TRINITY_DN30258_c0_g1~~TRINITY_DN30258_c0_g1_i4.p1  ORF type:complete len:275 (+),score=3.57 TRINITY_DN30258_c0_g1_i4:66-827(+)